MRACAISRLAAEPIGASCITWAFAPRTRGTQHLLSKANEQRDRRICADFAQSLIRIARSLPSEDDLGLEFDNTVYVLDASTLDWCLSVFPWALFRSTQSAVDGGGLVYAA